MNRKSLPICFLFVLLISLAGCSGLTGSHPRSTLKMPAIFSDHMVLQQGIPCKVWGWAKKGAPVTVEIADQVVETTAEDGRWQVALPALEAGGPYTLRVSTPKQTIELADVLVGEVWVCSGQSNMEWPVASANNAEAEIAAANYPEMRLFTVTKATSQVPLDDVTGEWQVCTPETVGNFSAVGYFFGRDLLKSGVQPIGLIHTSWGGTPAEAWTSMGTLKSEPDFAPILARDAESIEKQAQLLEKYGTDLLTEERDSEALMADTSALEKGWAQIDCNLAGWETMELPTTWEEKGLTIDGVVWFRKEVTVPKAWAGNNLVLTLSCIDDMDVTCFNGTPVGRTDNRTPACWQAPRIYTVPGNLVKAGKNVIAVRVVDMMGGGGIYPSNIPMELSRPGDMKSIDLTGPWHYRIESILSLNSGEQNNAARLYNAMLVPLAPYGIKGAIWYQGESNADRAYQYRKLFAAMIQDWRDTWNIGDFPFYYVQLANYMQRQDEPGDSQWAELREAQAMAQSLFYTGMAVTIDVGDANDIHPRDKQTVGHRLALLAQAQDYGQDVQYSGPAYHSMEIEGDQIRLHFDFETSHLIPKGGPLTGFAIAGEDRQFHWGKATIEGRTVVVKSKQVPHPVAVRYGWADNPDCNLYNAIGLPASPFRTDRWPGVTIDNK